MTDKDFFENMWGMSREERIEYIHNLLTPHCPFCGAEMPRYHIYGYDGEEFNYCPECGKRVSVFK